MLNTGADVMHTGHLQEMAARTWPTKQHSASLKWDTGPATTLKQHPTKLQPMLPTPHGQNAAHSAAQLRNNGCGHQVMTSYNKAWLFYPSDD